MTITLPAVKCVVIADVNEVDRNVSPGKTHANSDSSPLLLLLTTPDGKQIQLVLKLCERGQAQITVPDEG